MVFLESFLRPDKKRESISDYLLLIQFSNSVNFDFDLGAFGQTKELYKNSIKLLRCNFKCPKITPKIFFQSVCYLRPECNGLILVLCDGQVNRPVVWPKYFLPPLIQKRIALKHINLCLPVKIHSHPGLKFLFLDNLCMHEPSESCQKTKKNSSESTFILLEEKVIEL